MTSSSGPGISLKQEGISYAPCDELPGGYPQYGEGGPGMKHFLPSPITCRQPVAKAMVIIAP